MRICYLADASSTHTQRWVEFFAEQGHEVHLLSHTPYAGASGKVHYHPLPAPNTLPLWSARVPKVRAVENFFREWSLVRRKVKELDPDVIHGHFVLGYGHRAYLSRRRPLVISAWGTDVYWYRLQSPWNRLLTRLTLRSADLVTCDSDHLRRGAIRLGADAGRSHVVHHGVDTTLFRPLADREQVRRELGVEPGERLVLSPRSVRPNYNTDTIVRAFARVTADFPAARLIVKDFQGYDDYRSSVKALAAGLGVGDRVRFIDHVPYQDMAKLYNAADVVVSLATTDSAPMSVLEAMACGAAVVATDLPSIRDWIEDGVNGYLASPRDVSGVADQVGRALKAAAAGTNGSGRHNYELIRRRCEYRRHMEEMERLYRGLVTPRGRGPAC